MAWRLIRNGSEEDRWGAHFAFVDSIAASSYRSIEGTGRFDSIDQWVTTEVRGWTLSDSISEEQLAGLIEAARDHLGEFETADGCLFGMTATVATWRVDVGARLQS